MPAPTTKAFVAPIDPVVRDIFLSKTGTLDPHGWLQLLTPQQAQTIRSALGPPDDSEPDDGQVHDKALLEGPLFRHDINRLLDTHRRLTMPVRSTVKTNQIVADFNHDVPDDPLTSAWINSRLTVNGEIRTNGVMGPVHLKDRVRREDAVTGLSLQAHCVNHKARGDFMQLMHRGRLQSDWSLTARASCTKKR